MRTKPPPGYKKVSDWVGKAVETTTLLRNRVMEVPVGTRCTVTHARGGLRIKTDPCPHCGVQVFVSKVMTSHVRLVGNGKDAEHEKPGCGNCCYWTRVVSNLPNVGRCALVDKHVDPITPADGHCSDYDRSRRL